MIVVTLDEMLHRRRMSLTELADAVGITLANLSILKTGKARAIRFSTLDAIEFTVWSMLATMPFFMPAEGAMP